MCVCVYVDGSDLAAIGGRDISLFLFRALGKILYCKRETVDDEQREGEEEGKKKKDDPQCLPKHLQHHERCHLLVDPEVYETHLLVSQASCIFPHVSMRV